jgi:hypothetical protein
MELDIFSQVDDAEVRPLMRIVFGEQRDRAKPASVRQKAKQDDSSVKLEDVGETESEKLANLHSEKRGKPAPLPVQESDFAEGSVRRSLKTMPKGAKGKK